MGKSKVNFTTHRIVHNQLYKLKNSLRHNELVRKDTLLNTYTVGCKKRIPTAWA